MVEIWSVFGLNLGTWSRSVKTRPKVVFLIWIWEHIISEHFEFRIRLLNWIHIPLGRRHEYLHIGFIVSINVRDNFLHLLIVLICVLKSKVTTPWKDHVVATMSCSYKLVDVVDKFVHLFLGVERSQVFISFERVIVVDLIVGHPAVVVSEKTGQDAFVGSEMLWKWTPQKLHSSVLDFGIFV